MIYSSRIQSSQCLIRIAAMQRRNKPTSLRLISGISSCWWPSNYIYSLNLSILFHLSNSIPCLRKIGKELTNTCIKLEKLTDCKIIIILFVGSLFIILLVVILKWQKNSRYSTTDRKRSKSWHISSNKTLMAYTPRSVNYKR